MQLNYSYTSRETSNYMYRYSFIFCISLRYIIATLNIKLQMY